MTVASPKALWLLALLVPIILVLLRNYGFGRHDLTLLGGRWREQESLNVYLVKSFFGGLFFCLFYIFMVLSLAGFSWGQAPVEEDRSGIDIVIAVDVSRSMLAQDIRPSRLDRSRDIIRGLLRELPGSRYGIDVFKGTGAAVIPVTEDRLSIQSFLDYLGPQILTSPGTNLERGIDSAIHMFPAGTGRFRVVVLFSDGEAQAGDALKAAARAAKLGIPVFTVVAGTVEGATIPLSDGNVVRDASGKEVVTRAHPGVMASIAVESGGKSFSLSDPAVFSALLSSIQKYAGVRTSEGFRLVDVPRYAIFLSLALLFLLLSIGVRVVKWKNVF